MALTVPTAAATDVDQTMIDYLERMREETAAPSISVALAHRGEIAFSHAVGFADLERSIKATPETVYRTGSIAKVITVVQTSTRKVSARKTRRDTLVLNPLMA